MIKNKLGEMVLIPSGTVRYPNDKIKEVEKEYYIDIFPITNMQYYEFLVDRPDIQVPFSDYPEFELFCWNKEKRIFPIDKAEHPVVYVRSDIIKEFCAWRSSKDKIKRIFDLPTRDEWVKAAGGDRRIYPWGDQFDQDKCNTSEAHLDSTTSVFKYPNGVSPYGCWDMAGNVLEKTKDGYILGGCWTYPSKYARLDFDGDSQSPDYSDFNMGFRCIARNK